MFVIGRSAALACSSLRRQTSQSCASPNSTVAAVVGIYCSIPTAVFHLQKKCVRFIYPSKHNCSFVAKNTKILYEVHIWGDKSKSGGHQLSLPTGLRKVLSNCPRLALHMLWESHVHVETVRAQLTLNLTDLASRVRRITISGWWLYGIYPPRTCAKTCIDQMRASHFFWENDTWPIWCKK